MKKDKNMKKVLFKLLVKENVYDRFVIGITFDGNIPILSNTSKFH